MYRRAPLRFDPAIYVRSLGLLARNPSAIVVPLLMGVVGIAVSRVGGAPGGGVLGGVTGGLIGLVVLLLQLFGFGVACLVAEPAWRHGRSSFDAAWSEARRKGGDIFFAAIGFSFILSIAQYAGAIVPLLGPILSALAAYFLIYSIPAAAIGGVPGGAAIQVSIERVQRAPLPAAVATAALIVLWFYAAPYLAIWFGSLLLPVVGGTTIVVDLIFALFQAIAAGYMAFVLSKQYDDIGF